MFVHAADGQVTERSAVACLTEPGRVDTDGLTVDNDAEPTPLDTGCERMPVLTLLPPLLDCQVAVGVVRQPGTPAIRTDDCLFDDGVASLDRLIDHELTRNRDWCSVNDGRRAISELRGK